MFHKTLYRSQSSSLLWCWKVFTPALNSPESACLKHRRPSFIPPARGSGFAEAACVTVAGLKYFLSLLAQGESRILKTFQDLQSFLERCFPVKTWPSNLLLVLYENYFVQCKPHSPCTIHLKSKGSVTSTLHKQHLAWEMEELCLYWRINGESSEICVGFTLLPAIYKQPKFTLKSLTSDFNKSVVPSSQLALHIFRLRVV